MTPENPNCFECGAPDFRCAVRRIRGLGTRHEHRCRACGYTTGYLDRFGIAAIFLGLGLGVILFVAGLRLQKFGIDRLVVAGPIALAFLGYGVHQLRQRAAFFARLGEKRRQD